MRVDLALLCILVVRTKCGTSFYLKPIRFAAYCVALDFLFEINTKDLCKLEARRDNCILRNLQIGPKDI